MRILLSKKFDKSNKNIIFDTNVVNTVSKKIINIKGKFDTGATDCYIKEAHAKDLGLYAIGSTIVTTANSSVHCKQYIADLEIEGEIFKDVIIIGLPNPGTDFLIGMDIIMQGKTVIEPAKDSYFVTFERGLNLF